MLRCRCRCGLASFFFFFNDTATTEIYTLSLHDALPISRAADQRRGPGRGATQRPRRAHQPTAPDRRPHLGQRSEEHTSELQSHVNLVCRLLLEKKKKKTSIATLCLNAAVRTRQRQYDTC